MISLTTLPTQMRSKPRKGKTQSPGGEAPRREAREIPVKMVIGEPRSRGIPFRLGSTLQQRLSGKEDDRTPNSRECTEQIQTIERGLGLNIENKARESKNYFQGNLCSVLSSMLLCNRLPPLPHPNSASQQYQFLIVRNLGVAQLGSLAQELCSLLKIWLRLNSLLAATRRKENKSHYVPNSAFHMNLTRSQYNSIEKTRVANMPLVIGVKTQKRCMCLFS